MGGGFLRGFQESMSEETYAKKQMARVGLSWTTSASISLVEIENGSRTRRFDAQASEADAE